MIPPLGELYELLRADGFPIGVDDHIRIGRLLARDTAWDADTLKIAIGSLVVKDLRDRPRFDACWRTWLQAAPARADDASPTMAAQARPRRPLWAIAAAAIGALGVIAFFVLRRHPEPPMAADDESVQPGAAPVGGAASAPDQAAAGPCVPIPPPPPHSVPPQPERDVELAALLSAGAGGVLLVGLVAAAGAVARKRRRFLPGPWRYRPAIPVATKPVLSRLDVEDGAADLTWQAHVQGDELDVDRTVARTAEAGGMPVIVHVRPPAAPRYLVLEDVATDSERWRFVYDELLRGLVREGVVLERATFVTSPEICRTQDGKEMPLRELLDQVDALIAIGDGAAAVDPLTGERAEWLATLRHVPRRLWINPLPVAQWSEGAHAIAIDTPMEHGAARALAALHAGVDRTDLERPYPAIIERAPATGTAIGALRAYLGDRGFELVAAVAAAGAPTIAAARWLAEALELRLHEADWLRLAALPWFAAERWPDGVRDRLRRTLDGDAADRVNTIADRMLAGSEPRAGSAAHLAWRLEHAERLAPEAAARELALITITPFAPEARRRLAALGLPDRRRRAGLAALAAGCALVSGGLAVFGFERARDARALDAYESKASERKLVRISEDNFAAKWSCTLIARVVDGNGDAVPGAPVAWSNSGAAQNTPSRARSGEDGVVQSRLLDDPTRETHDATQTLAIDEPGGGDELVWHYHLVQTVIQLPDVTVTDDNPSNGLGNASGVAPAPTTTTPPPRRDQQVTRTQTNLDRLQAAIDAHDCDAIQIAYDVAQRGAKSAPLPARTDTIDACWKARADAALAAVIRSKQDGLHACYQAAVDRASKSTVGAVDAPDHARVTVKIDASGVLTDVQVGDVGSIENEQCVAAVLQHAQAWSYHRQQSASGYITFVAAVKPSGKASAPAGKQEPAVPGQPVAIGDLDKAIIRRYIKLNMPKIQNCFAHELARDPKLRGTVNTRFAIGPDGKVMGATATGVDEAVDHCIEGVISAIEFPAVPNGGVVQTNYPFIFNPAD